MGIKQAVVKRFKFICMREGITYNELAVMSGVTASTVYSFLNKSRKDVSIITIKKLCDGLDITLSKFFDTKEFNELEQEIE